MLNYILLGMLREPQSGYALRKRFETSAAHFWTADQSQIYRTLKTLEDLGLVSSRRENSESGPDRRVYRRLRPGLKALESWLRDAPTQGTTRLGYVGQLYFLAEVDDTKSTLSFLEALLPEFQSRLSALEAITVDANQHADDGFHAQLSLNLGLVTARARLEWCQAAIAKVRHRHRRPISQPTPGESS